MGLNVDGPAAVPELCCALSCLEVHDLLYITPGFRCRAVLHRTAHAHADAPCLYPMPIRHAHIACSRPCLMVAPYAHAHAMPVQCHALLHCDTVRCAVLCCAVLCCAVLC